MPSVLDTSVKMTDRTSVPSDFQHDMLSVNIESWYLFLISQKPWIINEVYEIIEFWSDKLSIKLVEQSNFDRHEEHVKNVMNMHINTTSCNATCGYYIHRNTLFTCVQI